MENSVIGSLLLLLLSAQHPDDFPPTQQLTLSLILLLLVCVGGFQSVSVDELLLVSELLDRVLLLPH